MHRHSYQGKKFARTAAPRRALMRGLLDSLILYERVETTEVKAKELSRLFDRVVTKAKQQTPHSYRQIQADTINPIAAEKLFTDLVKGLTERTSGYTRVIKTGYRLGDAASMAVVEVLLDADYKSKPQEKAQKPVAKKPAKGAVKTKVTTKAKTKKAVAGAKS